MKEERAAEPLVRTVDQLKSTTTSMRSLADSVDHLLTALEEFYPFIEQFSSSARLLRTKVRRPSSQLYRRRPPGV